MQLSVSGKQIDVGEALRIHVEAALTSTVGKYFDNAMDAHVVFSRVAHMLRADISVHVGRGILVQGHGESSDPYLAFDSANDRIAKRLRRNKRRLRNHHKVRGPSEILPAQQYILSGEDEFGAAGDEFGDGNPVIIAEEATEIATLTVGEAVMRMDLADLPAIMFRNSAHGGLNMVYRRPDGNIGWVDPRGSREKSRDTKRNFDGNSRPD